TSEFLESLASFYKNGPDSIFKISGSVSEFKLDYSIQTLVDGSSNTVVIASAGIRNNSTVELVQKLGKAGIPVLAEAGAIGAGLSGIDTYIDGANSFLRHDTICSQLKPDLILRFGDEPVGKGLLTY